MKSTYHRRNYLSIEKQGGGTVNPFPPNKMEDILNMARLIDADELKSLYSKQEVAIRKVLFSVIDRTPESEEGKYKRLAEQYEWERDYYEEQLNGSIPIRWLEDLLKSDKVLMNYKVAIYEIIEKWREENDV